jgi:hypothetical protein
MKILFLPLDNRPCTMSFAAQMAPIIGAEMIVPPQELLGEYLLPGNPRKLIPWLREHEKEADAAIISLDMALYGGLIASRGSAFDDAEVEQNFSSLEQWLRERTVKPLYLFSVIMRTMPTFTSGEVMKESPGFKRLQKKLYDVASHHPARLPGAIEKAKKMLTGAISPRYFDIRARNHRYNMRALELRKKGLIDYLMLGLDDVVTVGLNLHEKQLLVEAMREPGLEAVDIYAGTDEMAMMLLGRLACQYFGKTPSFALHYSSMQGRKKVPLYEDSTFEELIDTYISIFGDREMPGDPDIELFVHLLPGGQVESAWQKVRRTSPGSMAAFVRSIDEALKAGRITAIADIAYANGADRSFSEAMAQNLRLSKLSAYGAWNTAGNTLGTVITQATLRWLSLVFRHKLDNVDDSDRAHLQCLFSRFLDDWIYQSEVREKISSFCRTEGISPFNLDDDRKRVEHGIDGLVAQRAEELFRSSFAGPIYLPEASFEKARLTIEGPLTCEVRLPWPRIFEIAVECDFIIRSVALEERVLT